MNYLQIALANCEAGREEEFNDWYDNVMCWVCMKIPGAAGVQRFQVSKHQCVVDGRPVAPPHAYLTLYEAYDLDPYLAGMDLNYTPELPVSSALKNDFREGIYVPRFEQAEQGASYRPDAVIIDQIDRNAMNSGFVEWYREERFARIVKLPGVVSGVGAQPSDQQPIMTNEGSAFLGIYRSKDLAGSLRAFEELARDPTQLPSNGASVAAYEAIMPWLPAHKALFADQAAQANAERALRAVGDRVHPSFEAHIARQMS